MKERNTENKNKEAFYDLQRRLKKSYAKMRIKMPAVRIAQGEISNLTSLSESVFVFHICEKLAVVECGQHFARVSTYANFSPIFFPCSVLFLSCEVYSIVTARKTTRSR